MESITSSQFALYSTIATLLFYQKLHLKNFKGSSQNFLAILGLSASLGTIAEMVYIVYFGWNISWTGAAIQFAGGMIIAVFAGGLIERFLGGITLSLTAFVGWPICAYFLFRTV